MDQWSQTKVLDIIPQTYRFLIFDKTSKKATQNKHTHTQAHTEEKEASSNNSTSQMFNCL